MTASAWTILQLLGKLEARVLALGSEQERTTAFVNFFSYFKRICLYYFNFRQPPYAPRTRRHYYYSLSWIKHFWVPEMWLPFLDSITLILFCYIFIFWVGELLILPPSQDSQHLRGDQGSNINFIHLLLWKNNYIPVLRLLISGNKFKFRICSQKFIDSMFINLQGALIQELRLHSLSTNTYWFEHVWWNYLGDAEQSEMARLILPNIICTNYFLLLCNLVRTY